MTMLKLEIRNDCIESSTINIAQYTNSDIQNRVVGYIKSALLPTFRPYE